jgi:1-deoxy-D-xylulose-5-phosphate reductoisomerase
LALAQEALRAGGARPAILNAANEIAVEAFLLNEIGFLDIASIAAETLQCCDPPPPQSVEEVLLVDRAARAAATGIKQRFLI